MTRQALRPRTSSVGTRRPFVVTAVLDLAQAAGDQFAGDAFDGDAGGGQGGFGQQADSAAVEAGDRDVRADLEAGGVRDVDNHRADGESAVAISATSAGVTGTGCPAAGSACGVVAHATGGRAKAQHGTFTGSSSRRSAVSVNVCPVVGGASAGIAAP